MKSAPSAAVTLFAFLTLVVTSSHAARLLLVVGNMNSHVIQFSRLGSDLARLGHDVRLLVPSNARIPDIVRRGQQQKQQQQQQQQQKQTVINNDDVQKTTMTVEQRVDDGTGRFDVTPFEVDGAMPFANSVECSEMMISVALTSSKMMRLVGSVSMMTKVFAEFDADGRRLINNDTAVDELRRARYDFLVVDSMSAPFLALPTMLDVPFATVELGLWGFVYRVPRLASFVPIAAVDCTDRMTFGQRLINFVGQMPFFAMTEWNRVTYRVGLPDGDTSEKTLYVGDALRQAALWFLVEDIAVGYALPLMPNTVAIGDIAAGRHGAPLPDDLESFVAKSVIGERLGNSSDSIGGTIIVSFGSYFDHLPDHIAAVLCEAFRRLGKSGRRRVIWKTSRDSCADDDKSAVKTMPWIPQNDLLADRRVSLFVTHGGLNSVIEAVYHAKPLVVFPINGDQVANAVAAVAKGFAVRMDIADFTADSLVAGIDRVLSDPSYRKNAELASAIMRDRHDTPAVRVSEAINHVLKHGDRHLRSGAFELNTIEFIMFDVFAVLYLSAVGLIVGCFLCCRFSYRRCCRRRRSGSAVVGEGRHGKRKSD